MKFTRLFVDTAVSIAAFALGAHYTNSPILALAFMVCVGLYGFICFIDGLKSAK